MPTHAVAKVANQIIFIYEKVNVERTSHDMNIEYEYIKCE